MNISVINVGTSNIQSIVNAFEILGVKVKICEDYKQLSFSDAFILPGVGSFNSGIEFLKKKHLFDEISNQVLLKKKPILGICLGMQILCSKGFENNLETQGLNFIEGEVKKICITKTISKKYKVPHIGWNEIKILKNKILFKDINHGANFYFLHSYHVDVLDKKIIASKTFNGIDFTSSIESNNIFGVQFHPEKSQKLGLQLLLNWYNYIK